MMAITEVTEAGLISIAVVVATLLLVNFALLIIEAALRLIRRKDHEA